MEETKEMMSANEQSINEVATVQSVKPKRPRRGLTNEVVATSRLKFKPSDADPSTGLFLAHLESVDVRMSNPKEDNTSRPSFNGLAVPYIVFTFASNEADASRRKYVSLNFSAVESNANTIPGGSEDWKVDQVFRYLKHILEVYVLKGNPMPAEMEGALTLPFEDFDEEGYYIQVEPEKILDGWRIVLENYANILNTYNNGKPAFVNPTNGNFVPVWIKLLASVKGKQGWKNLQRGELTFPIFTGEGVVERAQNGVAPVIRINSVSESLKAMVVEEAKTPTPLPTTGSMLGGVMAPSPMVDAGASMVGIDDMPFGGGAPF